MTKTKQELLKCEYNFTQEIMRTLPGYCWAVVGQETGKVYERYFMESDAISYVNGWNEALQETQPLDN